MSMGLVSGVSSAQITAQLDAIVAKDDRARAVAVRSSTRRDWPEYFSVRGKRFSVCWCDTLLGVREALLALDVQGASAEGVRVVLLTPFATHELPDDVTARLFKARVWQPEGWDIVREMFEATEVDARLARHGWMPQLLIDAAAAEKPNPVATGFLDLETAWRTILKCSLGLNSGRPDAQALLAWSQQADALARLDALPVAAQTEIGAWLEASAGMVGKLILATRANGRLADALPIGLVCSVVFAQEAAGVSELGHAAVRLERYVGDLHIGIVDGRSWAKAATELVTRQGLGAWQGALDRADHLLGEIRAGDFAWMSDTLHAGLDQRMLKFGAAAEKLAVKLAEGDSAQSLGGDLNALEQMASHVRRHALIGRQPQRLEQVDMACRLSRWLVGQKVELNSVAAGIEWQADEGAFVDWARFRLRGGDDLAPVSAAYSALRSVVSQRRAQLAGQFADWLANGNGNVGGGAARIVPVEAALERLVAPLAETHPVLLLVMDGLSLSIFRELFAELSHLSWAEWVREDVGRSMVGVAAFPTVTEVSRASLLSGKVATGGSSQEKAAFGGHPSLLAHSNASAPPRLFHKGELAEDGSLSSLVRTAISDGRQKVVGVVYNAVDDHLSGPDQLHQAWRLDELRLLMPLLREARDARRLVVLTADHGHLLEDGTRLCSGGERDRCRDGAKAANDDELLLQGPRVLNADGQRRVVCLWGEDTRYTSRKNGYHGGASLPEVAVPMSVLVPLGMSLPGWQPAVPPQPEWWDLKMRLVPDSIAGQGGTAESVAMAAPRAPLSGSRKKVVPEGQGALFDFDGAAGASPTKAAPHWVDQLLASETYGAQQRLAARVALPDDTMRRLLCALEERGGKLSRTAAAQRLAVPEVRLAGMLAAARRVLNVDQMPVLELDEGAGTIELNLPLLMKQFGLDSGLGQGR